MWTAVVDPLKGEAGFRCSLRKVGAVGTWRDVATALAGDPAVRKLLNQTLAEIPGMAFRWECPGITQERFDRPFECVVLDDQSLHRTPDISPFASHLKQCQTLVAVFDNLGGDATLVVPTKATDANAYGHLASFVRLAPDNQQDELWQRVGETLLWKVGAVPVWLNTAGAGVAWLHVRLDSRPKYYHHGPYRQEKMS
ncbi:MAG: hypothetical protein C0478_02990 [Planctomyces sp.]|nr:hypothetical protein [Planctomyces sp.]